MCEETSFGKQTDHNSSLIYCSAVTNSKWKWLILNSEICNSLISTALRFSVFGPESVHAECDTRLSWDVMVL